jgi:membrane protein implicated in regulation of membrane protease activity
MSAVTLWFVIASGLLVVELLTGTFYLLMIAIGCVVGGVCALLGAEPALQLVLGAAVGFAATMILRRTRWGRRRLMQDPAENRDVILDIGEVVEVHAWHDGNAHVHYRGCRWDAALEPGAEARTGAQVIKAIRGSTLIVAPAPL